MLIVAFMKRSWSPFAIAIRLWTRSRYSHCELVFPDGSTVSADTAKGVVKFRRTYDSKHWDLVHVPTTPHGVEVAEAFCSEELGCRYDWVGIAMTQFLGWGPQSKTKWFCSELCTEALRRAGVEIGPIPAHWVSPGRLYKLLRRIL